MIALFWAAVRFQVAHVWQSVNDLMVLVTMPLFTVAFLAVLVESGREDLAPYAIVGSGAMSLWSMAVNISGGTIEGDRRNGVLEAAVATPAPLVVVLLGRITAVTVISQLGLVESALVAWLGFGITIEMHHPLIFLLTVACNTVAVVGTATALAGVFVLGRWALTLKSSLTYPFYVLGGAVVPVTFLPEWLQPLTRVVFLSWSAQLLRDCLSPAAVRDVPARLAVLLVLGAAAFAVGLWVIERILRRLRAQGTVGYA
ncbi:ABC transporter permease [Micromonospora sp. NPDC023956]|uniref:ABC transporter permease n=1 Tax=Micromonospora sp. NPDC023956 TaxID=3155722 RepID=UPI0033CD5E3C